MKPARFNYLRPQTLEDALRLLSEHGSDAAVLAGGQSLLPMLNLRFARPTHVVDIKRVPGLERITLDNGRLAIGPLARHADVIESGIVRAHAPLLGMALGHVAHATVRNRGTFGGSLALADPAAELPACVVCLEAVIVVASTNGERRLPATEFFRGLYTTALAEGEMILSIEIPVAAGGWSWDFNEVTRRKGDFAMAGLALGIRKVGERIAECRVVFCGVEAAPRRITAAEQLILGARLGASADIQTVIQGLEPSLQPLGTNDYPSSYRVRLAGVLLQRALGRLGGLGAT